LQCVAVCCSVLHCVAACCSVLQCVVVCYSVLQCYTVCCSVGAVDMSASSDGAHGSVPWKITESHACPGSCLMHSWVVSHTFLSQETIRRTHTCSSIDCAHATYECVRHDSWMYIHIVYLFHVTQSGSMWERRKSLSITPVHSYYNGLFLQLPRCILVLLNVHVSVCVCACVHVCTCVWKRKREIECVCACVRVCEREHWSCPLIITLSLFRALLSRHLSFQLYL